MRLFDLQQLDVLKFFSCISGRRSSAKCEGCDLTARVHELRNGAAGVLCRRALQRRTYQPNLALAARARRNSSNPHQSACNRWHAGVQT